MTIPQEVRALRRALGENCRTFGARFYRSGRSVEDWESGRRHPDPLALEAMRNLAARQAVAQKRMKTPTNSAA